MNGLILVAHGSKKELSNKEFLNLSKEIKNKSFSKVEAAFLEFATPTISEVVKEYIKNKITKIYIYPYFLNSGKHVSIDLPNILEALGVDYPNIEFTLLPHFGSSSKISDIINEDINSSI